MGNVIIKPDGQVEGKPADLKDIFQDQNSNLGNYLKSLTPSKKKTVRWIWLIVLTLFFLFVNICLWCCILPDNVYKISILVSILLMAPILMIIEHNFGSHILAIIALVILSTIMAISLGFITPKDAINSIPYKVHSVE